MRAPQRFETAEAIASYADPLLIFWVIEGTPNTSGADHSTVFASTQTWSPLVAGWA
jgi:hypothetical protein